MIQRAFSVPICFVEIDLAFWTQFSLLRSYYTVRPNILGPTLSLSHCFLDLHVSHQANPEFVHLRSKYANVINSSIISQQ